MTHRERILATVEGKATDQLPFVPRLDLWYKANQRAGTLPTKYRKASLADIVDDLGVGYHCVIPDFLDFADPLDTVDRPLGIWRLRSLPYRVVLRDVKRNVSCEGDSTIVEYLTPAGKIRTRAVYDEAMKRAGVTLTHVAEFAIKSIDDYEAVAHIFRHAEVEPQYDRYLMLKEEVGERGVVVAFGGMGGSPMHYIIHELMPYDLFFYHYYDHRKELEWLAEQIAPYFERLFQVAAESPAEIILVGSNYDTQITWPPFFRDHITPSLAKVADTLHAQGKFLLTHTDGENKGLLSEYVKSKVDIADSICPAPMTSLSLAQIREAFSGRITIWGGIPSVAVLESSMSDYEFEQYLDRVCEEAGRGDHLIVSIADTTPPDAKFSRIQRIAEVAKQFGPVEP